MRHLLVCQRDPECGWATVARADSLRAEAELRRERHHSKHGAAATPALRAEPAAKGSAPSGSPEVTPLGEGTCRFCAEHYGRHGKAVVWLADGRGACGAHHQALARLPVKVAA